MVRFRTRQSSSPMSMSSWRRLFSDLLVKMPGLGRRGRQDVRPRRKGATCASPRDSALVEQNSHAPHSHQPHVTAAAASAAVPVPSLKSEPGTCGPHHGAPSCSLGPTPAFL